MLTQCGDIRPSIPFLFHTPDVCSCCVLNGLLEQLLSSSVHSLVGPAFVGHLLALPWQAVAAHSHSGLKCDAGNASSLLLLFPLLLPFSCCSFFAVATFSAVASFWLLLLFRCCYVFRCCSFLTVAAFSFLPSLCTAGARAPLRGPQPLSRGWGGRSDAGCLESWHYQTCAPFAWLVRFAGKVS